MTPFLLPLLFAAYCAISTVVTVAAICLTPLGDDPEPTNDNEDQNNAG